MANQNVTVSLSGDLVREAKHLAVDRGVSLSKFVAMLLEERLQEERLQPIRAYREARDHALERLKEGLPLGTNGVITWTRESLHER